MYLVWIYQNIQDCGSQLNYCWPSSIWTISRSHPTAHLTNSSSSFYEETTDKLVNSHKKIKEYYNLKLCKKTIMP